MNRHVNTVLLCSGALLGSFWLNLDALGQDTLAPDQYEPNNTQSQAFFLNEFRVGDAPPGNKKALQASFHDASDDADWYRVILANPPIPLSIYWPGESYYFQGCYPYMEAFEVALSGIASGAEYTLSLYDEPSSVSSNPPLPLSVNGNQNVRIAVQFSTNNCGSYVQLAILVRRGNEVAVNEAYTLTLSSHRIMPPPATITSISPTSGPAGTTVTITGTNLGLGPTRFVGGGPDPTCIVQPETFVPSSPTSIRTTVPTCAKTGPIQATTVFGGGIAVSSQTFAVTSETPPPSQTGRTSIKIPDKGQDNPIKPGATKTPSATLPPFRTPPVLGAAPCCAIVPISTLKGRLGRLKVAYPGDFKNIEARTDIYKAGDSKSIASGYGSKTIDLLPGTYDVVINGKRVSGVTIKSAHETRVKVGVLHVNAGKDTKVDILDATTARSLTGGHGEKAFGFPVGSVNVKIAGQSETVTIEEGKVTEF